MPPEKDTRANASLHAGEAFVADERGQIGFDELCFENGPPGLYRKPKPKLRQRMWALHPIPCACHCS